MSEFNEDPMDADIADDWAAALSEQHNMGDDIADGFGGGGQANRGVDLPQGDVNLDVILDVPVTIAMEIGRTRISIRNLLQLSQGSVVELDRLAGEPLDVYVNGTLIAHGEVVVVNDKFGIRLTDVISPTERIKKLK